MCNFYNFILKLNRLFTFFACNIKNCVYFVIKFATYSKSPKTRPIRSNFSIKHSQCTGIQVNNSYAI